MTSSASVEDRVRRALRAVAELPMGDLVDDPAPPGRSRPHRAGRRRKAVVVTAVLAVAALIAVAVVVGSNPTSRSGQRVQVGANIHLVPADVVGVHEQIAVAPLLPEVLFTNAPRTGPGHLVAGSEHTFKVDGTVFTVQEQAEGRSVETEIRDISDPHQGGGWSWGDKLVEFTDPNIPVKGRELTLWTGLAKSVAFVTYTFEHRTMWQRPLFGTAGFAVPVVTTMRDTTAGLNHLYTLPAYDPLLRAYDASGTLVSQYVVYVGGPLWGQSDTRRRR